MITTQPMFDADLHYRSADEILHHPSHQKNQHPRHMPTTATAAPTITLLHRHSPDGINDFLRHQFGIEVTRPLHRPLYVGKAVVDTVETNALTTVFHLLGWGKTKAAARAMALTAAARLQLL